MAARTCLFCGASSDEAAFDKEHVLPKGLKDLAPNEGDWEATTGSHANDAAAQYRFGRRGPVVDLQVRSVCKSCNGGWMSRLEAAAQPLLRSLATGESRILTGSERCLLARWSIKTAYVHESVDKASQMSSPLQRRRFWQYPKEPGPHRVTMFFTQEPGRQLHRSTVYRGAKGAPDFWIYSEFIRLSHLAIQVWIRSNASHPGQDALNVPIHRDGIVMWPPAGYLTTWPPKRQLGERVAMGLSGGSLALLPQEQFRSYVDEAKSSAEQAQQS